VTKVLEKGLIVDLGDNVEGFVPISQIEFGTQKPLTQVFRAGDELDLKVLECNAETRRIVLQATSPPPERKPEPPKAEKEEAHGVRAEASGGHAEPADAGEGSEESGAQEASHAPGEENREEA
jgi:small subunit ribosomal protein S1